MTPNTGLKKDLSPDEFQLFRDWIHQHSGIFLEDSKMDSLRISLVTRATRLDITDYQEYFRLLTSDEDEFKQLMNLVTINETSFFRFPAQFDALRDIVIPEIVDGRGPEQSKRFRVWSAGCSTGEEPYTISMTLLDSTLEALGYSCEVVGTDVSTQALEKALRGIYPARSVANLPQQVVQRHFEEVREGYRPSRRVREKCDFHYHNLIKEPYPLAFMSNWDVIFCRNVTIYFRLESTKRVVNTFYEALNPGGYLFIGHSETLTSVSDRFEPVEVGGVFLYRKPRAKRGFTFSDIVAKRHGRSGAAEKPARRQLLGDQLGRRTEKPEQRAECEPARPSTPGLSPDERRDLVRQAHAMLESAQADKALAIAKQVIASQADDLDAYVVAAFALADLGDLGEAANRAREALRVNPLAAPARYILGVIAQQHGDSEAAIAEFKKTLYIDRNFVLAHFALANIYKSQRKLNEACREYENTLRALYAQPEGSWTTFLGGFRPDLLAKSCERSLIECGRGARDA